MQINRLLEMVYILLNKKTITAKELSNYFDVSQRTIYRDLDTLSTAGIPIYTSKGKGGGIRLLDNFVLHKSILTEKEQVDILASLQSLKALNMQEVEPLLNKVAAVFGKHHTGWIDVDFSRWGSNPDEREKFNTFKTAILNKRKVSFYYFGSNGTKTERTVEPVKLVFKDYAWYLYAFCHLKNDGRLFKVSRIMNLTMKDDVFVRETPAYVIPVLQNNQSGMLGVVLNVHARMVFRVFDELGYGTITENPDGSYQVAIELPEEEWLYGYILSFGDDAEVLAPDWIRDGIKNKLEQCLKKYS